MTTDKTSTAPVMSLRQVRDALHEAHNSPGLEAVLDSCVAAIDACLNATTPAIEHIAQQWDGCTYESVGEDIDIGEAIRAAARNFATTPDVVGGDVVDMLQAGFITARSNGPDQDYRLDIKFPTLDALQAAHNALVTASPRVQGRDVVETEPGLVAGRLPTYNQDEYPGLHEWWVQVWESRDEDSKVFARAYGDTPEQASERAKRIVAALAAQPKGDAHPDDVAVDAFAVALKAKLAEARAKGRGGWNGDEPGMQQRLSDMLRAHVEKGDPRDVANFAMFLHQRGESILPAEQTRGDGVIGAGIGAHALAAEIAVAVAGDAAVGEYDIPKGVFGPQLTTLVRRIVQEYLAPRQAAPDGLTKDAARYRWLCHDHVTREQRIVRDSILSHFSVRSYSANSAHIDEAMIVAATSAGRMGVDRG